jgi:uncharacterized protein YicC (UPF0701 family)
MKIYDRKVKEILETSVSQLIQARRNSYNNDAMTRQDITSVISSLDTLVKIIEFDKDETVAYDVDKVTEQIEKIKSSVAQCVRLNTQEDDIEREVKYALRPYDVCLDILKGAVNGGQNTQKTT